jgi:hypothetical protein
MGGKAAIIMVVGLSFILGYISLNMGRMSRTAVGNMSSYNDATASHNLAAIGANVGLAKFYADTTWFGSVTQTLSGSVLKGSFTTSMTDLNATTLRLRSVSNYPLSGGKTLHDTVEVFFDKQRKNSFSVLAWMTEFEGNVFWITGDTVWGRVHSNGNLHINGVPTFMEKVTTGKHFDPKPGVGTNKAVFKQGYETGIAKIDFPNDLSEVIGAAAAGGKTYANEIWISLSPGTTANNDGKAYVRLSPSGPIVDSINVTDPFFNGVIYGLNRVHVQGTLDGKMTIASIKDIIVENDILYEKHPSSPSCDDLLGLVSEKNVVVAENTANNSSCEIHASIFSRTGSFTAEEYNSRPISGELRVYGSIVQHTRGAVGTFSGSKLKTGFSKRYRYDARLSDPAFRPPYYPGFYLKTYAIRNWWESYRIVDFY